MTDVMTPSVDVQPLKKNSNTSLSEEVYTAPPRQTQTDATTALRSNESKAEDVKVQPLENKRDGTDSPTMEREPRTEASRLKQLQDLLLKGVGEFKSGFVTDAVALREQEVDSKYITMQAKSGIVPGERLDRQQLEIFDVLSKNRQEELARTKGEVIEDLKKNLESVFRERQSGEFGPATKSLFQQYANWLQQKAIPSMQLDQAKALLEPPPENPVPLQPSPNIDPRTGEVNPLALMSPRQQFHWILAGNKLPESVVAMKFDNIPGSKELERLGLAQDWMTASRRLESQSSLNFDVHTVIPNMIRDHKLPATWGYEHYPGADKEAYRQSFSTAEKSAVAVRNLLHAALDYDKLNVLRQGNATRALNESELRAVLQIPREWKIELDDRGRLKSLDLDLPKSLELEDPVNSGKLGRLDQWLTSSGMKIQRTIDDAIAKGKTPAQNLFYGTTELGGSKVIGKDGKPIDCNVLQCDFDVATKKDENGQEKIVVTYTMQPQNAHLLSYRNYSALCSNVGSPIVETREYAPDDLVVTRNSSLHPQVMEAKELSAWKTQKQLSFWGEHAIATGVDVGLIVGGAVSIRAAKAGVGAGEVALRMTASEAAAQTRAGAFRMALGATGVFNNGYVNPTDAGRAFHTGRSIAIGADLMASMPQQLRTLMGGTASGADKMQSAINELGSAWKAAHHGKEYLMGLSTYPMLLMTGGDLYHQTHSLNYKEAIAPFEAAAALVNGDSTPKERTGATSSDTRVAARMIHDFANHVMKNEQDNQSGEVKHIVHETERLLKIKEQNPEAFQEESGKLRTELIQYFRKNNGSEIAEKEALRSRLSGKQETITDSELRRRDVADNNPESRDNRTSTIAAAALLLLSRDAQGRIAKDATVASRQITVPPYSWNEIFSDGENAQTITHDVAQRELTQELKASDLIAALTKTVETRESGPERVVAAETLTLLGSLSLNGYGAVLLDALHGGDRTSETREQHSQSAKSWAFSRIGGVINALRIEEHQAGSNDRSGALGLSAQALTDGLGSIARNGKTESERVNAQFILRALTESPDAAREILSDIDPSAKPSAFISLLKQDLNDPDVPALSMVRSALSLHNLGELSDKDLNQRLLHAISQDPASALEAVKGLQPQTLTEKETERLQQILLAPTTDLRIRMELLAKTGPTLPVGSLLPLLNDSRRESTELRWKVIDCLSGKGGQQALDAIVSRTTDSSAHIRLAAIKALESMRPDNLSTIVEQRRLVETDVAVRMKLDSIDVKQTTKPEAAKQYNQFDNKHDSFSSYTGIENPDQVRSFLQDQGLGLLLNLKETVNQKWLEHSGSGISGRTQRAASRVGRGTYFLFASGVNAASQLATGDSVLSVPDVDIYGDRAQQRFFEEYERQSIDRFKDLIDLARTTGPQAENAISVLGHIARNNGNPLCDSFHNVANNETGEVLINLAKQGNSRDTANPALRELFHCLRSNTMTPDKKVAMIEAVGALASTGSSVAPDNVVELMYDVLDSEHLRLRNHDDSTSKEYSDSAQCVNKALNVIADLKPRANLDRLDAIASDSTMLAPLRERAQEIIKQFGAKPERTAPSSVEKISSPSTIQEPHQELTGSNKPEAVASKPGKLDRLITGAISSNTSDSPTQIRQAIDDLGAGVLLNLRENINTSWQRHCGSGTLAHAARGTERVARGVGWLGAGIINGASWLATGNSDVVGTPDLSPYGERAQKEFFDAHVKEASSAWQNLCALASPSGQQAEVAISVLGHVARNNGEPLCDSLHHAVRADAPAELARLAQHTDLRMRDLAVREIFHCLQSNTMMVQGKEQLLGVVGELVKQPALAGLSTQAARDLLFKSIDAEYDRMKNRSNSEAADYKESVRFIDKAMSMIETLDPSNAYGKLQAMAQHHTLPEVRERAQRTVAHIRHQRQVTRTH